MRKLPATRLDFLLHFPAVLMIVVGATEVRAQATDDVAPQFETAGPTVNVGQLVNLQRDVKNGTWELNGSAIHSGAGLSVLQLPVDVPAEYVLEIDVVRTTGKLYFGVALVVGDHQCYAEFDGPTSGLGLLDGKSAKMNLTTVQTFRLQPGQPTTLRIIVLNDGVATTAAGRTIVQFLGDMKRLKLPPNWVGPDRDKLYLKADGGFAVSGLRLTPVKTKPK